MVVIRNTHLPSIICQTEDGECLFNGWFRHGHSAIAVFPRASPQMRRSCSTPQVHSRLSGGPPQRRRSNSQMQIHYRIAGVILR